MESYFDGMAFPDEGLPLGAILLHFLLYLMVFLKQVLKLPLQHFALIVLLRHEMGPLGEFHLQRGVFLLILLVFLKEGLQPLHLLILLAQGSLDPGNDLPLLFDLRDVELVNLHLRQDLEVLAQFAHSVDFKFSFISRGIKAGESEASKSSAEDEVKVIRS